jgi:hypothetical protein
MLSDLLFQIDRCATETISINTASLCPENTIKITFSLSFNGINTRASVCEKCYPLIDSSSIFEKQYVGRFHPFYRPRRPLR